MSFDLAAVHCRRLTSADAHAPATLVAYRFGFELACVTEPACGLDWARIERRARAGWTEAHPGTWDAFVGAIRAGWRHAQTCDICRWAAGTRHAPPRAEVPPWQGMST